MGQNNFRSIFNAALLGVPLPLCSCGVIPTGISFFKHGASKASTVSFLISTPQTGVDSIFVTYSMLGLPLAIISQFDISCKNSMNEYLNISLILG